MARSIRAAGGRPGDELHNAYGYGLFTGGLGAHYGAEKLGCTVIPVSGGMTPRQVQLIQDFAAAGDHGDAVLHAHPDRRVREAGRSTRARARCEIGIFGAEPWTEQMRREIEERLDIHAVDIYGLSEVMGPGVAQECVETKDGLHIWEDHFYPGGHRPGHRRGAARGRGGRARASPRSPRRPCRSSATAPAT